MLKHTALAAILIFAVGLPIASAQTHEQAGSKRHGLQRAVRLARLRVGLGVRAGRITAAERGRLLTNAAALRGQVQALRQSGARPTPEQRRAIRQGVRRLNREIFVANHHRLRRGR